MRLVEGEKSCGGGGGGGWCGWWSEMVHSALHLVQTEGKEEVLLSNQSGRGNLAGREWGRRRKRKA